MEYADIIIKLITRLLSKKDSVKYPQNQIKSHSILYIRTKIKQIGV